MKSRMNRRMTLWNCASDVLALCSDVEPGDGRMEACLIAQHAYLTAMCAEKKQSSFSVPMSCKDHVETHCSDIIDDGLRLTCLRRNHEKISAECKNHMSALESDSWEMLHHRFKSISVDSPCTRAFIRACRSVTCGKGGLQDCVAKNWQRLHADCGLLPPEMPEKVHEVCQKDSLILCKHIAPGNSRVGACLRQFDGIRTRDGLTLSDDCRSALILEDAKMDIACASDVSKFCGPDHRSQEELVSCLRPHQEKLAMGCTIRKHMHEFSSKAPMHENLHTGASAEGCTADISKFCAGIPAGQGLIHACLLKNRHKLSPLCRVPRGQVVKPITQTSRSRIEEASDEAMRTLDDDMAKLKSLIDREVEAFQQADLDSSGDLDVHEYVLAIRYLLAEDDTVHIRSTFMEADLDGSNTVDASEFHLFASKKLKDSSSNTTDGNVSSAGTSSTLSTETSPKEGDSSRRTRRLNVLQIFFSSKWIFIPALVVVALMVFTYRSSVRRAEKPSKWLGVRSHKRQEGPGRDNVRRPTPVARRRP